MGVMMVVGIFFAIPLLGVIAWFCEYQRKHVCLALGLMVVGLGLMLDRSWEDEGAIVLALSYGYTLWTLYRGVRFTILLKRARATSFGG